MRFEFATAGLGSMLQGLDHRYVRVGEAGVLAHEDDNGTLIQISLRCAGFPHFSRVGSSQDQLGKYLEELEIWILAKELSKPCCLRTFGT